MKICIGASKDADGGTNSHSRFCMADLNPAMAKDKLLSALAAANCICWLVVLLVPVEAVLFVVPAVGGRVTVLPGIWDRSPVVSCSHLLVWGFQM